MRRILLLRTVKEEADMHVVQSLSEKIWHAKLVNEMEPVKDFIAPHAHFVHMGITFDKEGELEAFNSQKFIYQDIKLVDEHMEDFGQTVIIYKKLVLLAVVKGTTVENPFIVTEVFSKTDVGWQLVTETYTRIANEPTKYRFL